MRYFSSIMSSSLGNILEWYDFGLFTIFSSLFSHLFFPTEDPHVALIATISIFAVGFFCRPVGALIFGYLGDRYGRANTLRLSILMISLPTLLIAFLPSYQQVGIVAPMLLMLIRIWQGISIGGEYSGNLIYLAETSPAKHRAVFTSFASMGANLGILLATLVGILTSSFLTIESLETWGWRLPYLISGLFCLFIYFFRLRIKETIVFDHLKEKHLLAKNPIITIFKNNFPDLLRTIGMVCMGTTFYYFSFIYLPIFLGEQFRYSIHAISILMSLLILVMILVTPMAGLICDRIGRRKMLLFNSFLIIIIVIPGYSLLQGDHFTLLVAVLLSFTIASSLEQSTTPISVIENFPLPARYTGVSLGYNLGNGFLGGTVPIVCEWIALKTHITLAPAFYITLCAAVTGFVIYFFVPETRGKSLNKF